MESEKNPGASSGWNQSLRLQIPGKARSGCLDFPGPAAQVISEGSPGSQKRHVLRYLPARRNFACRPQFKAQQCCGMMVFQAKNNWSLPCIFRAVSSPDPPSIMPTLAKSLVLGAANAGSDSSSLGDISDAFPKLLRVGTDADHGAPGSCSSSQFCRSWCTEFLGCPQESG